MSWASLIPAAGSILGGIIANRSAHQAADAQAQASQAAMAEQQCQYNQTRQDQMPWLTAGQNALAGQQAVLHGDYSGFQNSPDYAYALQQGLQGVDRSAAARGSLYSGGHQADLVNYAQGLAMQNLNNYWNRLAGMSNAGQAASSHLASFGQNYAANMGNQLNNAAQARGWATNRISDNTTNMLAGVSNALGDWYEGRQRHTNNGASFGNASTADPYARNPYISDPYRQHQWYAGG